MKLGDMEEVKQQSYSECFVFVGAFINLRLHVDGPQDLNRHGQMMWHSHAESRN